MALLPRCHPPDSHSPFSHSFADPSPLLFPCHRYVFSSVRSSALAEQKRSISSSGRHNIEYFSGHVKKYRYIPPRNPSNQLGRKKETGPPCDDDDAGSYALSQQTAMMKIIEKLRDIQRSHNPADDEAHCDDASGRKLRAAGRSAGELFLPKPDKNLFSIGCNWSTPDHPVPAPGRGVLDIKFPWEFDDTSGQQKEDKAKRVRAPTLAEVIIPSGELKRLRTIGISLENPLKIGRLGVTDNIADSIMRRWHNSELVKVKCQGAASENMLKIHADLERKTGGLVVWRSGSVAVVYRGSDFDVANNISTSLEKKLEGAINNDLKGNADKASCNFKGLSLLENRENVDQKMIKGAEDQSEAKHKIADDDRTLHDAHFSCMDKPEGKWDEQHTGTKEGTGFDISQYHEKLNVRPDPFIERDYEMEIDGILESLGPRFKEWRGLQPAPVDADLLPSEISNYRPPYRLLPYGTKPKLTNYEQTNLRRLVRHIPPHFAIGRNRGLQGLAAATLKLWERSEVVKIALKSGVQNINNEIIAEELKRLTGGVLLGRDKYFITLYRGKDFLPQQLAIALTERLAMMRTRTIGEDVQPDNLGLEPLQSLAVVEPCENTTINFDDGTKSYHISSMQHFERKLAMAIGKKQEAEQDLKMLEDVFMPVNQPDEIEILTEEERYMFRKLGLKMSPFLLVGKRGIFDGIVENMHLHWKHRELVKIIVKERDPEQLQRTAKMLEYASGGVLVSVVATSKGHAIIMYRGKNYERPSLLRPHNLLTKKEALKRSVELQRCASLSKHIQALEKEITKLKAILENESQSKSHTSHGTPEDEYKTVDMQDEGEGLNTEADKVKYLNSDKDGSFLDKQSLLKLVQLGPISKADPLTNTEKFKLRKQALKLHVGSRFNIGKSNMLEGLARHIRIHFLTHALVAIGIKNRSRGTSVQDLIRKLEELTGGVLVSYETNKIILYRGWQTGEKIPMFGSHEEISPDLRIALETEDMGWDLIDESSLHGNDVDDYDFEMVTNEDESIDMLEEEDGDEEERYFS